MDALLLKKGDLLLLAREHVEFQHLDERVAVLGRELDGKFQEIFGLVVIEMPVRFFVGHG